MFSFSFAKQRPHAVGTRPLLRASLCLLLVGGLSFETLAEAQGGGWSVRLRLNGQARRDHLGASIAPIGDIDNDLIPDVAVGAPDARPAGMQDAGEVIVFSGTGTIIARIPGTAPDQRFGWSVESGADMSGDGIPDLLVGAPGAGASSEGHLYLYSGADLSLLQTWVGSNPNASLGRTVSFVGDWSGDGWSEAVSNEGLNFRLVGMNGWDFKGDQLIGKIAKGYLSVVHAPRDANFEVSENRMLLGYPNRSVDGVAQAGELFVIRPDSSKDEIRGIREGQLFGASAAFVGDLDGGSEPEILVGLPGADAFGLQDAGRVDLYKGEDLSLIGQWKGTRAGDQFGTTVAGLGDVNGDGIPDFAAGSPTADGGGGTFAVYSGADFSTLWWRDGKGHDTQMGFALSGVGDTDGNGFAEILVGAPGLNTGNAPDTGAVLVFDRSSFISLSSPTMSAAAGGHVDYELDFSAWEGGGEYLMLYSISGTGPTTVFGIEVPLTADTVFTDSLNGNPPAFTSNTSGNLDGKGIAISGFTPVAGALSNMVGRSIWAAAIVEPPGQAPTVSSEAVELQILP